MENNQLFACEYGYILYKVLIRAFLDPETKNRDDLIITDASQDLKPLYEEIRNAGLFRNVYFFDCSKYRDYYNLLYCVYPQGTIKKHLFVLRNYMKMCFAQYSFKQIDLGFSVDFSSYKKIYCSDHPYVINGYLANHKINYTIIEHAKNVYLYMTKPYDAFYTVVGHLDKLSLIKGFRWSSVYCEAVEVYEKKEPLPFCLKNKKLIEWNVDQKIQALSVNDKDKIFKLYASAYNFIVDYTQEYNLLLTNPLFSNAFVRSEKIQIQFYKDIIEKHFSNAQVLIKPHPKDTIDYREHFSEHVIVDPNITSEMLVFSKDLKINKALTLFSSSINSFKRKAKQTIILEATQDPTKIESLKDYR